MPGALYPHAESSCRVRLAAECLPNRLLITKPREFFELFDRTLDKTIGLETMCVGGGMGMAMIVERLN
ncbi:MAG: hypothetical protein JF886_07290 [Candidatus Dormibacteraeota bacterium]|uniref:Uncharacterized protein n=1 Tax=Candidatus Aeolococcus gillhamiae TaxID=3127015 RepID=A0A2W6A9Z0_9BACT|nr:hypothetical protein [Candidatus Dormibacteraeota bacterium]PZR80334.1 MAG: hypothetical protein DLM65_08475 [Candidatus Dormibacter sp. RRmetagenome_bin12]